MRTYTLGISCYYHDSAAALSENGKIIGALQEERLSRKKNDDSFPKLSIEKLLSFHQIAPEQIDTIVYYEKPFLTFERLIETYHALWPRGVKSFLKVMPLWIKDKIFLKSKIFKELKELGIESKNLLFPEHHHSHMASAFYPSPFTEAAILTLDGVGEWKSTALAFGQGSDISLLAHQDFPHSLGLFYSGFTSFCGFRVNNGEYKLMGLAPYAKVNKERVEHYNKLIKEEMIALHDNGGFALNLNYFQVESAYDLINQEAWESFLNLPRLPLGEVLTEDHAALSLACQKVTEEIILKLAQTLKERTNCGNLCLSGGVALNCVANGLLAQSGLFKNIWIQPAAGDAGSALGAALLGDYLHKKSTRTPEPFSNRGSLLGPSYHHEEMARFLKQAHLEEKNCKIEILPQEEDLLIRASNDLHENKVIGWFQGPLEFGPRALGSRSILANPKELENQRRVNLKIKKREGFRPFAPAILDQDFENLFGEVIASPYMQFVHPLKAEHREGPLQNCDYTDLPDFIKDQLGHSQSLFGAITHVDGSCRVQRVIKEEQELFWKLLEAYKKKSGIGILLNTSFNIRGEPIVESPRDAVKCFLETDLDILYLGRIRISKN